MIEIAGRRVRLSLGRGRSQTVNICTEAGRSGDHDWVLVLEPETFSEESQLAAQSFTNIEDFVRWLQRIHDAKVRTTPVRRFVPRAAEGRVEMVPAPAAAPARVQTEGGVHAGADLFIETFLGLRDGSVDLRHGTKRAAQIVAERGRSGLGPAADFVRELYRIIETNALASKRQPSPENWRFEKRLQSSERSQSQEKQIEKKIAATGGALWANQMPTAAGLIHTGDNPRNVDLVYHQEPRRYELIELKHESDTPLFAAMEILKAGLTFLYSRRHRERLGYSEAWNPILWAETVHLRVLAPIAYYAGGTLGWLAPYLSEGLAAVIDPARDGALRMDFDFQGLPKPFGWPCSDAAVRAAIAARRSPYPVVEAATSAAP